MEETTVKKTTVLEQARAIAARLNDPKFKGDRWALSMRLAILQQKMGALGIDAVHRDPDDED
jgi:hypothetical protein